MADWAAIRAAIATQMSTATGIREATSTSLSGIGMLPAVKVEAVDSIEINEARGGRMGSFENRVARISGKLLVPAAADVGRNQVVAEGYVEALYEAARLGHKLGMPTIVEDCWIDVARIGPQEYGGQQLYGADLEWVVKTSEVVERTP